MEKNKIMMIVIILLLVLLLGTIAGISIYVIGIVQKPPEEVTITPAPVVEVRAEDLVMVSAGEISGNLLKEGNEKGHVLKGEFTFGINSLQDDKEGTFATTLKDKIAIARDIILTLINNTTYAEVSEPNGKERLKEKILTGVRDAFQTTLIWEVYMEAYIYQ